MDSPPTVRLLKSHQTSTGQAALSVSRAMADFAGRHRWIHANRGGIQTEVILRADETNILAGASELGLRPLGNGLSVLDVRCLDVTDALSARKRNFKEELGQIRKALFSQTDPVDDPIEWLWHEVLWLEGYRRVSFRSVSYVCNEAHVKATKAGLQEADTLLQIAELCGGLSEDENANEFTDLEAYTLLYMVVGWIKRGCLDRALETLDHAEKKSDLWCLELGVPHRFQGV
eukprot:Protomagalhaensia_wolfi_Nauph_80__2071@NODE_2325_length_1127_cov_8_387868_g1820_i0_p1_GENE_NODE_2325_length_1127_cov_8_387868_g1820_i0NODE_2325_length_1127_cov_8_387868_g1820_i0_p1_ORF_typecomplete_len231_score31_59_NODE_2325_length_1127_cov_8_387868_g1820_i019711